MDDDYSLIKERDKEHSRASLEAIPPEYHHAVGQLMEASFNAGKEAERQKRFWAGGQ